MIDEPMIDQWPEVFSSGFEGLRLGDSRDAVRDRFGRADPFRRGEGGRECDQFLDYGLIVTYGSQNLVEFIEIATPANPTFRGVELLKRPLEEVVADLAALGVATRELRETAEGPVLVGFGIGLWVPDETVEAVSIGDDESR